MIQKFKEAGLWAKMGYVSLAITVILGLSNVGSMGWSQVLKIDNRYAKTVELNQVKADLASFQQEYKSNKVLQLEQQLFEMEVRWGADKSKWTDTQRTLYFQKKAELEKLKRELGLQ